MEIEVKLSNGPEVTSTVGHTVVILKPIIDNQKIPPLKALWPSPVKTAKEVIKPYLNQSAPRELSMEVIAKIKKLKESQVKCKDKSELPPPPTPPTKAEIIKYIINNMQ